MSASIDPAFADSVVLTDVPGDGDCYFHAVGRGILRHAVMEPGLLTKLIELVHNDLVRLPPSHPRVRAMIDDLCESANVQLERPFSIAKCASADERSLACDALLKVLHQCARRGHLYRESSFPWDTDALAVQGLILLLRRQVVTGLLRQLPLIFSSPDDAPMRQLQLRNLHRIEETSFFMEGPGVSFASVAHALPDLNISTFSPPAAVECGFPANKPDQFRLHHEGNHFQLYRPVAWTVKIAPVPGAWTARTTLSCIRWWNAECHRLLPDDPDEQRLRRRIMRTVPEARDKFWDSAEFDMMSPLFMPFDVSWFSLIQHAFQDGVTANQFIERWASDWFSSYRDWLIHISPRCLCIRDTPYQWVVNRREANSIFAVRPSAFWRSEDAIPAWIPFVLRGMSEREVERITSIQPWIHQHANAEKPNDLIRAARTFQLTVEDLHWLTDHKEPERMAAFVNHAPFASRAPAEDLEHVATKRAWMAPIHMYSKKQANAMATYAGSELRCSLPFVPCDLWNLRILMSDHSIPTKAAPARLSPAARNKAQNSFDEIATNHLALLFRSRRQPPSFTWSNWRRILQRCNDMTARGAIDVNANTILWLRQASPMECSDDMLKDALTCVANGVYCYDLDFNNALHDDNQEFLTPCWNLSPVPRIWLPALVHRTSGDRLGTTNHIVLSRCCHSSWNQ
jgi:hypothetical protein